MPWRTSPTARTIRVHVHGDYPIDRVGEAITAFQQGTRGKLVVSLAG